MVDTLLLVVVVVMVWDMPTMDSSSVFSVETESLITGSGCGYEGENEGLVRAGNEVVVWSMEGEDLKALDCKTASLGSSIICSSNGTGGEGSGQ